MAGHTEGGTQRDVSMNLPVIRGSRIFHGGKIAGNASPTVGERYSIQLPRGMDQRGEGGGHGTEF